jgi:hypothetical protein
MREWVMQAQAAGVMSEVAAGVGRHGSVLPGCCPPPPPRPRARPPAVKGWGLPSTSGLNSHSGRLAVRLSPASSTRV